MSCGAFDIEDDFLGIIKRHKKSERTEFKKLIKKYMNENPEVAAYAKKNSVSGIFNKRYQEVIREYNKMRGYVRFTEVFPEMILLAKNLTFEHDIGDMIANHFAKRYSRFIIIIRTSNKSYISTWRRDISLPYKKLKKNRVWIVKHETLKDFIDQFRLIIQEQTQERIEVFNFDQEEFHESYYDLQYVKERKNLRHAQAMLPHKYMKNANLQHEEMFFLKEKMNFKNKKKVIDYF